MFLVEDGTLTRLIEAEETKYGGLIAECDRYRLHLADPNYKFLSHTLLRMLSKIIDKLAKDRYKKIDLLIRDYISRQLDPDYRKGKIIVVTR